MFTAISNALAFTGQAVASLAAAASLSVATVVGGMTPLAEGQDDIAFVGDEGRGGLPHLSQGFVSRSQAPSILKRMPIQPVVRQKFSGGLPKQGSLWPLVLYGGAVAAALGIGIALSRRPSRPVEPPLSDEGLRVMATGEVVEIELRPPYFDALERDMRSKRLPAETLGDAARVIFSSAQTMRLRQRAVSFLFKVIREPHMDKELTDLAWVALADVVTKFPNTPLSSLVYERLRNLGVYDEAFAERVIAFHRRFFSGWRTSAEAIRSLETMAGLRDIIKIGRLAHNLLERQQDAAEAELTKFGREMR